MAVDPNILKEFDALKLHIQKDEVAPAKASLARLKIELAKGDFLIPDATNTHRFVLAREILEQAVLLSVKDSDSTAFERNFSQLKVYYNDIPRGVTVPDSERRWLLIGLNLLRLLSYNRIAEFHTELEAIPYKVQSENPFIRHSIELEQYLMEGSYHRLYDSQSRVPAPIYQSFMQHLLVTVQQEIGASIEKAYLTLTVPQAQKLLRMDTPAGVLLFGKQREWEFNGEQIRFPAQVAEEARLKQSKAASIPSMQVIHQTLSYAKELERIV